MCPWTRNWEEWRTCSRSLDGLANDNTLTSGREKVGIRRARAPSMPIQSAKFLWYLYEPQGLLHNVWCLLYLHIMGFSVHTLPFPCNSMFSPGTPMFIAIWKLHPKIISNRISSTVSSTFLFDKITWLIGTWGRKGLFWLWIWRDI